MISVRLVAKTEEQILSNLLQKYLYELSQYFDDKMNSDGNYPYDNEYSDFIMMRILRHEWKG